MSSLGGFFTGAGVKNVKATPSAPAPRTVQVRAHTRTLKPSIQPQTKTPAAKQRVKSIQPQTKTPASIRPAVTGKTILHNPTGPAVPPSTGATPAVALTPEQIIDQSLQALRDQLNSEYQSRVDYGKQAFQSLSKQLVDMLNSQIPLLQGDYQHAIDTQGQLGNYAQSALTNANPNPQLQADLQAIGAPASQEAGLSTQLGNVFAGGGGVSKYLTGYVPGTQLNEDMLAALINARNQPGIASLATQQDFGNFLSQQAKTLADQLFQVNSQKPTLLQKALAAQTGPGGLPKLINRKDGVYRENPDGTLTKMLGSRPGTSAPKVNTTLSKAYGVLVDNSGNPIIRNGKVVPLPTGASGTGQKVSVSLSKLYGVLVDTQGNPILHGGKTVPLPSGASRSSSGQKVSVTLSKAYGYLVDNEGNPILRGGKTVPLPGGANGGTKGLTPTRMKILQKQAGDIARAAWEGTPTTQYQTKTVHRKGVDAKGNPTVITEQIQVPVHGTTHLSYQEAMRDILATGATLKMAQKALNAYWTRPGYDRDFATGQWVKSGRGRPLVPYQQRPKGGATLSGGGAVNPDAARTPKGAKQAAAYLANRSFGWQGDEIAALDQLWQNESGWDYQIHNKAGSGAKGIPQFMPMPGRVEPAGFDTNPLVQINWGLNYIKRTYGTPSRALAFWYSTVNRNSSIAPPDLQSKSRMWIANGYTGY